MAEGAQHAILVFHMGGKLDRRGRGELGQRILAFKQSYRSVDCKYNVEARFASAPLRDRSVGNGRGRGAPIVDFYSVALFKAGMYRRHDIRDRRTVDNNPAFLFRRVVIDCLSKKVIVETEKHQADRQNQL